MLTWLANFWEIPKTSTKVRYSVIAVYIRGTYVIFVGATSFFAYTDARNPTNLGTPWEILHYESTFIKLTTEDRGFLDHFFSVFVSFTVSNRFGLTLTWLEWIFRGVDSRRRKDRRLFFSILIVNSSDLEPSAIFWKAVPSWNSIYRTTTAKLLDLTIKLVPPENCRDLKIKKNKIRKPKVINARTWFMKMMSFFHSIPFYVCNFRNCNFNLGEVKTHNKLWWFYKRYIYHG